MTERQEGVGFSGLKSLLPDVEVEVARAQQERARHGLAAKAEKSASAPASSSARRTEQPRTVDLPEISNNASRIFWVAAVVASIAGIGIWLGSTSTPTNPPQALVTPAPEPTPPPISPPVVPKPPSPKPKKESGVGDLTPPKTPRSTPREEVKPAPPPAPPALPAEQKPPVGRDLGLNRNQVRYCVFEKARLNAMSEELNRYSDRQVDLFNDHIDDYNIRCGSFRYYRRDMEVASSEADSYRDILRRQAIYRLRASR